MQPVGVTVGLDDNLIAMPPNEAGLSTSIIYWRAFPHWGLPPRKSGYPDGAKGRSLAALVFRGSFHRGDNIFRGK
jgi:hypothetical protein